MIARHRFGSDVMRPGPDSPWRRATVIVGCLLIAGVITGGFFMFIRSEGQTAEAQSDAGLSEAGKTAIAPGGSRGGGLRLCNKTSSQVGVALGFKEKTVWTTSGWWNIGSNTCETIVAGPLESRFYYIYAVDYDRGGSWSGRTIMCTRDKMFMIQGIEDCVARGYERTGFFEIDTGEQKNWTVQLTEPTQQDADGR